VVNYLTTILFVLVSVLHKGEMSPKRTWSCCPLLIAGKVWLEVAPGTSSFCSCTRLSVSTTYSSFSPCFDTKSFLVCVWFGHWNLKEIESSWGFLCPPPFPLTLRLFYFAVDRNGLKPSVGSSWGFLCPPPLPLRLFYFAVDRNGLKPSVASLMCCARQHILLADLQVDYYKSE